MRTALDHSSGVPAVSMITLPFDIDWLRLYQFLGTFAAIVFGMAWFPCCCAEEDEYACEWCDDELPNSITLDLSNGTLADGGCDGCDELNQIWILDVAQPFVDGEPCNYNYTETPYCDATVLGVNVAFQNGFVTAGVSIRNGANTEQQTWSKAIDSDECLDFPHQLNQVLNNWGAIFGNICAVGTLGNPVEVRA